MVIQAVDRALQVLEAVHAATGGLTLQELAQATGLRPTTAHNLAATLIQRGYLAKTPRPTRYRVGPALDALISTGRIRERTEMLEAAVAHLATRWPRATVTAAIDRGGDITVIARMSPEQPNQMQHPSHQVLSPYHSVSALVFEAFWPGDRQAAFAMRYPFDEYGAPRWSNREALEEFLSDVRRQGHAMQAGRDGFIRVAVPVFSSGHELVATLGVALGGDAEKENLVSQLIADMVAAATAR